MNIKLTRDNQEFILKADSVDDFFRQLKSLPAGEYTVDAMDGKRRPGKHARKVSAILAMPLVSTILDVIAVLLMLGCIVPLWIIGCALI